MIPEGWRLCTLSELAVVERGKFSARPRNDPRYYGGETPFVQTGDVSSSGTYLERFSQTLNSDGVKVSKVFGKGSILLTIAANIGETAIASFDVACPDSVVAVQPIDGEVNTFWLKVVLETKRRYMDEMAAQNAQKNINLQVLKPLEILTPPLVEQDKVAAILSAWDEAVIITEHLIEASQQQRNALSQQLLTGTRRLPGFAVHAGWRHEKYGDVPNDWGFVEIGSFSRQSSEKNRETEELPVLSCSKYDGFVDSLSYFNKRVYSEDLSGYKVIRRGDIGFPSNHVEEGSIGLQNLYDRGLVSPIYVVFRPDEERVDPEFLFRLLKTDHYRQVFAASTNASVDRRGSLRWKEFSAIKVPLPSLDEQKAIVLALKTADAEIQAQQQRLDCLRREKKALMQQLLTGKRRVKLRDEAA